MQKAVTRTIRFYPVVRQFYTVLSWQAKDNENGFPVSAVAVLQRISECTHTHTNFFFDRAPLPPRLLVLNANEPAICRPFPIFTTKHCRVRSTRKRNIIWSSFLDFLVHFSTHHSHDVQVRIFLILSHTAQSSVVLLLQQNCIVVLSSSLHSSNRLLRSNLCADDVRSSSATKLAAVELCGRQHCVQNQQPVCL